MISSHVAIPFLCLVVGSVFLILLLLPVWLVLVWSLLSLSVFLLFLLSSSLVYASDFLLLLATTLVVWTAIFATIV